MSRGARAIAFIAASTLVACAAVLGIPDPALDETIAPAGGDASDDRAVDEAGRADAPADNEAPDARVDGGPCNTGAPWGSIVRLDSLATASDEEMASLTADEQTIYFRSGATDPTLLGAPIMFATRANLNSPFGPPSRLDLPFAPDARPTAPCVVGAGTKLFYTRSVGVLQTDIFFTNVPNPNSEQREETVSSTLGDSCGSLAGDGSMVFWRQAVSPPGPPTYFEAPLLGNKFATPTPLPGFGATATLGPRPVISTDQLTIFYEGTKDAASGGADIYTARRPAKGAPFANHTVVAELSTKDADRPAWLSPDSCRLYFSSARPGGPGGTDLYVASRPK